MPYCHQHYKPTRTRRGTHIHLRTDALAFFVWFDFAIILAPEIAIEHIARFRPQESFESPTRLCDELATDCCAESVFYLPANRVTD